MGEQPELTINFGILELPGGNFVLEQDVDLSKGTILGLWKAEPTPNETKQVSTGIEETGLGTPAPAYVV